MGNMRLLSMVEHLSSSAADLIQRAEMSGPGEARRLYAEVEHILGTLSAVRYSDRPTEEDMDTWVDWCDDPFECA